MVYLIQFITEDGKLARKIFRKLKKEEFKSLTLQKTGKGGRWQVIEKLPKEKKRKKRSDSSSKGLGGSRWYDTEDWFFLEDLD